MTLKLRQTDPSGLSRFYSACVNGDVSTARELCSEQYILKYDRWCLELAKRSGNAEMLQFLLQYLSSNTISA